MLGRVIVGRTFGAEGGSVSTNLFAGHRQAHFLKSRVLLKMCMCEFDVSAHASCERIFYSLDNFNQFHRPPSKQNAMISNSKRSIFPQTAQSVPGAVRKRCSP